MEESIHKKTQKILISMEKNIPIRKQRSEIVLAPFNDFISSNKSKTQEILANQEKLAKMKEELRKSECDLADALAVKTRQEAKRTALAEAVSTSIARTKQLEKKVQNHRARNDEYASLISQQQLGLKTLEEKNKDVMVELKNIEEVLTWYRRVLGFRIGGGEGVKFIFNNINMKNPDDEYTFTVRLDGDSYILMNCDPHVEDINKLIEDLNNTNDLFKFVRIMREKFRTAALNETLPTSSLASQASTSLIVSSAPPISVDGRSGKPMKENISHLQPMKARKSQFATPSPQSISNSRRSPRFLSK